MLEKYHFKNTVLNTENGNPKSPGNLKYNKLCISEKSKLARYS